VPIFTKHYWFQLQITIILYNQVCIDFEFRDIDLIWTFEEADISLKFIVLKFFSAKFSSLKQQLTEFKSGTDKVLSSCDKYEGERCFCRKQKSSYKPV